MLSVNTSTNDGWASWVDPLLLDRLIDGELRGPFQQSATVALAIVDISGFTRLTETFMRAGPVGSERVKEVLDGTFGPLTQLATVFGGRVLKFPGDAVLIAWLAEGDNLSQRIRKAAAFALQAVSRLTMLSLPHGVSLAARCAIVSGAVRVMFVGGMNGHWECLVDGEPLHHLGSLLNAAGPGDVMMSHATRLAVGNAGVHAVEVATHIHRLNSCTMEDALPSAPSVSGPEQRGPIPDRVRLSVPTAVLDHADAEASGWLTQFRSVTAAFIRLAGPTEAPRPLDVVQRQVSRVQSEAARFGGALNQAVVDDKGTVLVLAWGLSRHAHEDDAARAVLAAMTIADALSDGSHQISIGVATGRVFTGARGGEERREYAMIGSAVNRAARLMQQSAGRILCDEATRSAARDRVEFERTGARGQTDLYEPLVASPRPTSKRRSESDVDDLVGRTTELGILLAALRGLEAGESGQTFIVEGEPGIGKSRLIASLMLRTQFSPVRSLIVRGDPIERSQYHPWRAPLERLLGLAGLPVDAQRARVASFFNSESQLARVPLLNAVLALQFEETETTLRMTPQGRAEETRELLLYLLSLAVAGAPTLLVLEDAHWFDTASWTLGEALVRCLRPLLCVVALRPMLPSDTSSEAARFTSEAATARLSLTSLSADEAIELARRCLEADSLPAELGELVWDKARGHPFYTEQLVLALRDSGVIHVDRGRCTVRGDAAAALSQSLPDTVQGIVTSRIDRLSPGQQIALKIASVVGMDFELQALHAVSPPSTTLPGLEANLDAIVQVGLLARNAAAGTAAYSFTHSITLQVAYDVLPFAHRRELHASVARQLEADGSGTHALLAHHWTHADVRPKAFQHLIAAGEAAIRGDSNREAVQFFRQALAVDLAGHDIATDLAAFQRARCHRLLAEALWVLGQFAEVPGEVASSFRLLGGRERWTRSRGRLLITQLGVQALHLAVGSGRVPRSEHRREQLLELARGASALAMLRASPRDTKALLADSLLTLNLAEEAGSTNILALGLLGYTADAVGLRRLANTYFERARARAPELGELGNYGLTLLFECMTRFGAGEHVRSVALMHEGLELARRIGDRRASARASDMLSSIHSFTFTESAATAMRYVTAAIDSVRDRPVADRIYFLETLRAVSAQLLRPEEARAIFEPVQSMVEPSLQHCTDDAAALMHASDALFHTRQGNLDAAIRAADAAFAWGAGRLRELPATGWVFFEGPLEAYLTAAEQSVRERASTRDPHLRTTRRATATLATYARRYPIYSPRARHFEARLAVIDGKIEAARAAWERSQAEAIRMGLVLDEARARLHLAGLAFHNGLRQEHLRRARALLERVGSDYFMDLLEREESGRVWSEKR